MRGEDGDPESDRRSALAFRQRWPDWGRYGLSAFYAEDDDAVDGLAAGQLERFPVLNLYRPADLAAFGLGVVPTFRSPHVTLVFAHLETGLAALRRAPHEAWSNPYHET
ncbi:MAG: hypothetical protein M0Z62_10875 [Actinomycetota bacterium]|nr:hypothetical protein [Actinomycetota bacterium]